MASSIEKIVRVTDTYANIKANMTSPQIAYATDTDATANVEAGTPITREGSTFHILAIQNHVNASTGAVTHADNHFGSITLFSKSQYDSAAIPSLTNDEDIAHKKYVDDTIAALTFVDGTGTTNKISKWSDSDTITDSIMTDDGSTVSVAGDLTATKLGASYLDYNNTAYDATDPSYVAGRTYYNRRGWIQAYSDDSDVLVELGATLLSKFMNNTGSTINKGQTLWVSGVDGVAVNFEVSLASCASYDENYLVGVAASDALNGEEVYFMQKGVISNINTSSLTPGVPVYAGETPGTLTTTAPDYPCRHVLIGAVLVQDAVNGVLGVNTMDTGHVWTMEGAVVEKLSLTVVVDTGVVYMDIEADGGGDFNTQINKGFFEIDATTGSGVGGKARIALTAGTSSDPALNYIYVSESGGTASLNASTSKPSTNYAMIAECSVLDSATTNTYGPLMMRRWTNARVNGGGNDIGLTIGIAERLRQEGAKYSSGVSGTLTVAGATPKVKVATTSGTVYQLWSSSFGAYDTNTDGVWVANASGSGTLTPFQRITDLADCLELADGTPLANNNRYNLVVFYCMNSGGYEQAFVNLPTGVYASDSDGYNDINNTSVVSVPDELKSTAFLGFRIPLKYTTAGGGTFTTLGTPTMISLLGNPIGLSGSSNSSAIQNEFSDSLFRVYDDGDITKELAFECSGITTGNTRTVTVPDKSGTMAMTSDLTAFIDGSGTTNYIPKFSDSNTIGNSIVTDDGTTVTANGDMTVTKSAFSGPKLEIKNTDATSNNAILRFSDSSETLADIYVDGGGTGASDVVINASKADGTLSLRTNSSERLKIAANGNVALGGAATDKPFAVKSSSTANEVMRLVKSSDTNVIAYFYETATSDCAMALKNAAGTDKVVFNANGTSHVSGGNVGIDISSPQSALHLGESTAIENCLQVTNSITGEGSSSTGACFGVDASGNAIVASKTSSVDMIFKTNNSEQMRILDDGKVGIENSNPGAMLDTTATALFQIGDGTVGSIYASLKGATGAEAQWAVENDARMYRYGITSDDTFVLYDDTANAVRLVIGTDGSFTMAAVYDDTVGGTNRDLFIDNTGKIGYVSSSQRYKENITDIENTSWIHQLRPVSFDYKEEHGGYHSEGLIAEEVELVREELVSYNEVFEDYPIVDENGLEWHEDGWIPTYKKVYHGREAETVSYKNLITPLLSEVQKLKRQNDAQQNVIDGQDLVIKSLSARLDALEALNG